MTPARIGATIIYASDSSAGRRPRWPWERSGSAGVSILRMHDWHTGPNGAAAIQRYRTPEDCLYHPQSSFPGQFPRSTRSAASVFPPKPCLPTASSSLGRSPFSRRVAATAIDHDQNRPMRASSSPGHGCGLDGLWRARRAVERSEGQEAIRGNLVVADAQRSARFRRSFAKGRHSWRRARVAAGEAVSCFERTRNFPSCGTKRGPGRCSTRCGKGPEG